MRQTNTFIPTEREMPGYAEAISHKYLIKAGMIKQISAGIYTYLPLANRVLEKIKGIIREEHEKIGATELLMPILQSKEYWEESGRWKKMGPELIRVKDRKDQEYAMSPTAEEMIVQAVRNMVTSYKNLPINLYQIQTKFRDEIRPRLGLLRCKEFIMKDAYSFHTNQESLDKTYNDMYMIYSNIFDKCGLKYRAVEADSGNIGGSNTHEFQALAEIGEDTIVYTDESDSAANIEMAGVSEKNYQMNNDDLKEKELVETPNVKTIRDLAEFLNCDEKDTVKAIAIKDEKGYYLILLRGDHTLNEVKVKKYLGISDYEMTDVKEIQDIYLSFDGFMGPIGLGKEVKIYADNAIKYMKNYTVGANKENYHYINVNNNDYNVEGYYDLREIQEGEIAEDGSHGKVKFAKGIEIGQIFKLGTIYSEKMNGTYLDENGKAKPYIMGCYGIGVSRLIAAIIEQNNDENGIIWPKEVAPYLVHLICLDMKKEEQKEISEKIYTKLLKENIEVLYDDRIERPGVKFNDVDLIGLPLQIIVGKKVSDGITEIKIRRTGEKKEVKVEELIENLEKIIKEKGIR